MKKASEILKTYQNENGPRISMVTDRLIEKDGLYFKDIDGSGEFKNFDDWRLSAEERAKAYVKELTLEEKIAQLFISDWRMGKYPCGVENYNPQLDESGILDNGNLDGKTIFGEQHLPGTETMLKDWFSRHLILRANPTPTDLVEFLNQLQAVAEECDHFIPVQVASNSRNENAEPVFGMNDAAGIFATWPGTLGIAAAAKGDGSFDVIDKFADCINREWNACGLRKGYMYMADCMSDPRWQRSYGTFGEDPDFIEEAFDHLIPGIQNGSDGVNPEGTAMTVKHFPGGGARENGFDPHYKAGQWNVYATEGSLEKYHIRGFKPAIRHKAQSIMPYYSKPSAEKSVTQQDYVGKDIDFKPYGFAYNKYFIDEILRKQMGFEGYINSDTGIVHNMCWGVEALDKPERIGFAVTQSGVDIISGLFDNEYGMEAYERGRNGYYDTHQVPEGFKKEDLILTDESIDRAVTRTLTEMFALGMFDDPYRDADFAEEVIANAEDRAEAELVHRKSVVLLKNDGTLPYKAEGKKIYAEAFYKNPEQAEGATKELREKLAACCTLTDDYAQADAAILMLHPSSGAYFSATPGYLELDLCEDKEVCDVDEQCRPLASTHKETTVSGMKRLTDIAETVHANGGKVISNVNVTLAWELGNIETISDVLTVGFDTFDEAVFDVIFGKYAPTGKLPITFPKNDAVLAVDADGRCISPNDVPGYDKDKYMPDELKDENGKAYAYRDAAGNYYELNYGLTY